MVLARTGEEGANDVSAFLVDATSEGISFGRTEHKLRPNAQPTRAINFYQVQVQLNNLHSQEGDEFAMAMQGLNGGRIHNIATFGLGAAQQAFKLDNKDADAITYCAMAKRFATDIVYQICDEALQCFGGYGYLKEYSMERYLRDSRVHRILKGTNDIMRVIIARRMLAADAQPIS